MILGGQLRSARQACTNAAYLVPHVVVDTSCDAVIRAVAAGRCTVSTQWQVMKQRTPQAKPDGTAIAPDDGGKRLGVGRRGGGSPSLGGSSCAGRVQARGRAAWMHVWAVAGRAQDSR